MMDKFEPITLGHGDDVWEVPPDKVLRLIARVEDALVEDTRLSALQVLMRPQGPGMARLSRAYGVAVRYAASLHGVPSSQQPTDEDIYLSIEGGLSHGAPDAMRRIQAHVLTLFRLIAPQSYDAAFGGAAEPEGKPDPEGSSARSTTSASASSD